MLKTAQMQKVRICALKSVVSELIAALHRESVLEIEKGDFKGLDEGRPLEFFNVVSEHLVRMRAINAVLEKYSDKKFIHQPKQLTSKIAIAQSKEVNKIEERIKTLSSESSAKESEIAKQNSQLLIIDRLLPFTGIDFSRLDTKTVTFRVGDFPSEKLETLKSALDTELGTYNLLSPSKGKTSLLIFKKTDKNVDQILSSVGFGIVEIPSGTTTPAKSKRTLENSLFEAQERSKAIQSELESIANEQMPKIRDILYSLEIEADRAEIASRFGFSKSIVVFEGWVLKNDYPKIEAIARSFGDKVVLDNVHFGHHELPPTVLENPKYASPFEFITKSYSLPNYYEMDPTMIYLIGIPLLLGMIVGDVIYGLLTILVSMWLMKKFEKSYTMSNVSKIWFYSGFAALVFGLIFDEWAGFTHSHIFEILSKWGLPIPTEHLYVGLSRLHNLSLLIGLTALLGLVHLALGFVLGAINEWGHNKKHAAAKIAWIGVEIGGTLAVCAFMLNLIPTEFGLPGALLLVASVIVIALTEGVVGVLEIPGLVGNVLSYARIAAIGVVGVVLAEIINEFFTPVPEMGLMLIITVPLFVAFHMINLFIAIFEALIQGGRLNLIEFRSKFLKGGGKVFQPFALRSSS